MIGKDHHISPPILFRAATLHSVPLMLVCLRGFRAPWLGLWCWRGKSFNTNAVVTDNGSVPWHLQICRLKRAKKETIMPAIISLYFLPLPPTENNCNFLIKDSFTTMSLQWNFFSPQAPLISYCFTYLNKRQSLFLIK